MRLYIFVLLVCLVQIIQFCYLETKTGQAVQYINDIIMKQTNGDRKNATDVVIIINVGIIEDKKLLAEELKKLKQKDSLVS